jgi:hypothetical protein
MRRDRSLATASRCTHPADRHRRARCPGRWRARSSRCGPRTPSRSLSCSTFLHRGTRSPGKHRSADAPHSQLQWSALGAGRGASRFALPRRASPRRTRTSNGSHATASLPLSVNRRVTLRPSPSDRRPHCVWRLRAYGLPRMNARRGVGCASVTSPAPTRAPRSPQPACLLYTRARLSRDPASGPP